MKIGIHQHVFTSLLTRENLGILDFIRETGFDSVDINVRNTDLEFAKVIRKRAEKLNLILTGGGSIPKGFELLSSEKQERIRAVNYMKELVNRVSEIGASLYHGILYATSGLLTGKAPTETELKYSVENLQEVADYASVLGIKLCLEPCNRYETYVLNTVSDSLDMIAKINRPNVGLLLDTYHMNIEEKNLYKSLISAGSNLFHLHVNENDRGIPGTGHIPWDEVFQALKDINYQGIAAVESFVDDSVDIAALVAIWRKLAPSAEILAKESYHFIMNMAQKYGLN
jgi:D-psicose/D-tagatose/L-ribulose 3-epimerase